MPRKLKHLKWSVGENVIKLVSYKFDKRQSIRGCRLSFYSLLFKTFLFRHFDFCLTFAIFAYYTLGVVKKSCV